MIFTALMDDRFVSRLEDSIMVMPDAWMSAKLGELIDNIATAGSKIDGLAGSIAAGKAEPKDVTTIREKEPGVFVAAEGS